MQLHAHGQPSNISAQSSNPNISATAAQQLQMLLLQQHLQQQGNPEVGGQAMAGNPVAAPPVIMSPAELRDYVPQPMSQSSVFKKT